MPSFNPIDSYSDRIRERISNNDSTHMVNMADPSQVRTFFNKGSEAANDSSVENGQLFFNNPFAPTSGSGTWNSQENNGGTRKELSRDWEQRREMNDDRGDLEEHRHGRGKHRRHEKHSSESDIPAPTPNSADNTAAPAPNPGDSNTQPASNPGDNNAPPVSNPGDNNSPPASNPGDNNTPPASNPGDNNTPPASNPGDNNTPPAPNPGDNTTPPLSTGDNTTPPLSTGDNTTPPLSTGDNTTPPESNAAGGEIAFYADGTPSSAEQVSATLGRPVAVTTFLNQNQAEQATTAWTVSQNSAWQAANPGTPISLGVPLTFENQTVQQTASGANNQEFVDVAQQLVNAGMGNANIRLGEEMNGTWYPWGGDPTNFINAYNNAAEAMKSVPGANFNFVWNPNIFSSSPYPFQDYWPGGQNVNTVGVDAYDINGDGGQSEINGTGGLKDILNFAEQQGKAFAVPEWGLWNTSGDDPAYINAMANFFKTVPDLSYQGYYGDGSTTPLLSANPQSQAAYNADFSA